MKVKVEYFGNYWDLGSAKFRRFLSPVGDTFLSNQYGIINVKDSVVDVGSYAAIRRFISH